MQNAGETNAGAALRVLVVDDDPAMRRLLSMWLTRVGYEVRTADDGQHAIEQIEADCPDILVTDWEMPRLDGPGLCRAVRQMTLPNYVYILFLTVRSARSEIVEGLETGADDFLTKPIEQAELLARMRSGRRIIELQRRLQSAASTDLMTGLPTRRSFFPQLEREWQRSVRAGSPLSAVMLDVDFFKRVNDQYGHAVGDTVLRAIADVLRSSIRQSDLICRFGGEEFCAVLPEATDANAPAWAERLRATLAAMEIPAGDARLKITCSFGAAQRRDDTPRPEQLLDRADQALLCAKQWGRDRVVSYENIGENGAHPLGVVEAADALFHGYAARDVMTPIISCLHHDQPIGLAADFFLRTRITSAPVVDEEGVMVGFLSEKDILAALASKEWWGRPIHDVMKSNVICYDQKTSVRAIFDFLCRVSIRRVVITDGRQPVGTISRGTLLRWVNNLVVVQCASEAEASGHAAACSGAARTRLVGTADALAQHARILADRLHQDGDDPVATVVGGVSNIQDMLDDLMGHVRTPAADAEHACTGGALMFGTYPD